MKERKEKKRMKKELRTRIEVVAALYLLNYLAGTLP